MDAKLRLDHVALLVRNLEASAAFYRDVLLLPEVESLVRKSNIRWFGIGEGQTVHLIEGDFGDTSTKFATHFALAMPAAAFEAFKDRLKTRNLPFRDVAGEPSTENVRVGDGARQIYFQDPDGYWIELVTEPERAEPGS